METPAARIRWSALGELLRREDLRVIRGADRKRLLATWDDICEREQLLEDRLFVGIIGGTGVGKSTLINAIAGSLISCAGDRRPTTDRVVVYRHRRHPLPGDFPRDDLADPEVVHGEDGLERTVVLDFPDFDSVETDHAARLARFIPKLDVLVILVDDEKYGDLRLFEVLRALPQSPRNLHFVLNKIDRLAERYPGEDRRVAREILEDLASKLFTYAGLQCDPRTLLAVSTRAAFDRRSRGEPVAKSDHDPTEGEFEAILALLDGYRIEKKRRAAKEANIDARKEALARAARSAGLDPEERFRAEAARRNLVERTAELDRLLESIGPGAVGPRMLRGLLSWSLDRAAPRLSFPLGSVLRLLRRRGPVEPPRAEGILAAAGAHFRPFREALSVAERELEAEVEALAGPCGKLAEATVPLDTKGREFIRDLNARLARALRLSRLRTHLVPAVLLIGGLWIVFHPVIAKVVEELADGKAVNWASVAGKLLAALVGALSPTGILSFLFLVALAYALAAWADYRRIQRAVDTAVAALETSMREDCRTEARTRFARLGAPLEAWERERRELETALGGPRGA